jgi:hypothetical protein
MLSQDHHTHHYRLQFTYYALPDKGFELCICDDIVRHCYAVVRKLFCAPLLTLRWPSGS